MTRPETVFLKDIIGMDTVFVGLAVLFFLLSGWLCAGLEKL